MKLLVNAVISTTFICALLCLIAVNIQIMFDMHPPFTDTAKDPPAHNSFFGVLVVSGRHLRIECKLLLDLCKHFVTDNPGNKPDNFNVYFIAMGKRTASTYVFVEMYS